MRDSLLVVATLVTAGCGDLVYDDDAGRDAGADVPVPAVVIESVTVPRLVAPGSTVDVTFRITGPAGDSFSYQLVAAASGGSFSPYDGLMSLDAGGEASLTVSHTAPPANGRYTHRIVIDDAIEKTFEVEVKPLQLKLGYPGAGDTTATLNGGYLTAFAISVASPVTVSGFGLYSAEASDAGGAQCALALYEQASEKPYQRLLASPVIDVVPGTNEIAVPSGALGSSLAAGTYWLAVVCDTDTRVSARSGAITMYWMTSSVQSLSTPFAGSSFSYNPLGIYVIADN